MDNPERADSNRATKLSLICAFVSLGVALLVGIYISTQTWHSFAGLALALLLGCTAVAVTIVSGIGALLGVWSLLRGSRQKVVQDGLHTA